ncbi:lipocalin-like domain-containing protein [Engelhardtia mirabilis]|uniref:Hydroxyneurosporene synthase (CrtC) n=1 Tax=Engelhardtia mirabilis TaxID=2528011 RepID=A0A518BHY5_9BACT|nr:Hydroxyneurosporene synthase (CrtC) [Planctomycetes bacterium Pla133]QDV00902.1 Hydroxyneurosporene synthase (CrtC) [Planctomycetes bacterium Pla86]
MSRRSLLLALLALSACGGSKPSTPAVALSDLLGAGDTASFARADGPRDFTFPADHGPHPGFRTEWWYVTGNLTSADGRPFGFHLTLFRRGLAQPEGRASDLAPSDLWMAHFAIADGAGREVHAHERTARGAGGLAGAAWSDDGAGDSQLRVWLEDWELAFVDGLGAGELPRLRLVARAGDDALELNLAARKPAVLQGDAGLSIKGSAPGQASYYYAVTRLTASGSVEVGGETFAVDGSAWLDREWSTSVLGQGQVGWDWFALQLDDGTDVMLYQMRLADGGVDATSHGSITEKDGSHSKLEGSGYTLRSADTWHSPRSGAPYPSGWTAVVPEKGLELRITPLLPDQELPLSVVYWEGAVQIEGTRAGRPVRGVGFVELTGYADIGEGGAPR